MIDLATMSGDSPTRVYISGKDGAVLGGVQDEKKVLRCFCRKGYAMKIDGEWKEVTKGGKPK